MKTPTPTWGEAITEILTDLDKGNYLDMGGVSVAKSALIQLFKDLVADAKPERLNMKPAYTTGSDAGWGNVIGYNEAIDQFEQNILKLLEER